ncbi:tripartite tricarboxylate transporter substrate binding protein [Reyranella sp. CPCC 100927]|uniref:Bug family tripartite tricarboxylate transporter substrate binding protein n=1 Tax=Reyranella sp. CPCC 100927 TaxID=2599616 RepID=UPI0011B508C8|nr:tripartite tricarboxylate transporter substrate binding protein [Reyranella sp. CPCC 100927]TWT06046.1 tripartite tricarboxylate transporter substrate binding protein [Reyranella sp. CPCC 100927]
MIRRRQVMQAGMAIAATASAGPVVGQTGGQPIRLVVPYGPGGSTDTAGRLLAERMAADLGRSVIVDNKPGGGTMVGMQSVAHSKPDGTTLLLTTTTAALLPAFDIPLPIDPQKSLTAVAQFADIPVFLGVRASHPAKTLADFTAWLKEQPGTVPYGTSSTGGLPHLWGELLNLKVGRKLEHIPYKAAAEALRDVVAGHVPAFVDVTTPVDQQVRSGTMRGLIVGAPKRVAAVPDVPTAQELGLPDLEAAVYFGVTAPAGTPADVIATYNAAINKALGVEAVRERLMSLGYIPTGGPAQAYTERLASETVRWRKVIKEAGIKPPA